MDCPMAIWKEGYQTFSARVPGYAQGACFPGDEPGYYCQETDAPCDGLKYCHCYTETKTPCPICGDDGFTLFETAAGRLVCPVCGLEHEEVENA